MCDLTALNITAAVVNDRLVIELSADDNQGEIAIASTWVPLEYLQGATEAHTAEQIRDGVSDGKSEKAAPERSVGASGTHSEG